MGDLVALLVVAGLLGGPATTSGAAALDVARPDLAAAFSAQINAARTSAGRVRLGHSSALSQVAAGWAAKMARTNVLAHNSHLASSMSGWHYLGENVGVGYSVASLEAAFWGSPRHRANMLDPDYSLFGIAVVQASTGKLWVVEDFERPAQVNRSGQALPRSRSQPRAHSAAPAHTKNSSARLRPPPSPLVAACRTQARRLFTARRSLRHGVDWALIRSDLLGRAQPASE